MVNDGFPRCVFDGQFGCATRVAKVTGTGNTGFVRVPGEVAIRKIIRNYFRNGTLRSCNRSIRRQDRGFFVTERNRFGQVFRVVSLHPCRISGKYGICFLVACLPEDSAPTCNQKN